VDRYQIIDDIGGGGMGRVRLARGLDGRLVVLKTAIHEEDDERLRDEARVGLRLHHPGLVETIELFDTTEHGRKRPVLVTAYVPGTSLMELRRHGPLPGAVVCRLGRQLAEALSALHTATGEDGCLLGVVHRDVTAANCLVGHDGHARLIDLGIARSQENRALRTEAGMLRGTLRYLAPELFDGGPYSPQTDLWSLGVALWEALLGRVAVVGNDAVAIERICAGLIMVLEGDEHPDPIARQAVAHLLAPSPLGRPRSAADAADLFAAAERILTRGDAAAVDAAIQQALREAVAPDFDAPTSERILTEASRRFRPEPLPAGGPESAKAPHDHAARLAAMERAHAAAWEEETKRQQDRVRQLAADTIEGATVVLDLPPTLGGPPRS
jgi:eukaryotic-like serine/threonine-protein kinase